MMAECKKKEIFQYKANTRKKLLLIFLGICICTISFLMEVMMGASEMTVSEIFKTLFRPSSMDKISRVIIWQMRLPVAVMGIVVGASLGLSGAVMQTILNNPLASPYTLGLSAGAGFGASVALTTGLGTLAILGNFLVPICAFVFSLIACLGIYIVSKIKRFTSGIMVLAGIGMVLFFEAGQSFLQYMASPEELSNIVFWTFGSLMKAKWFHVTMITVVFLFAFIFVFTKSWKMTAMSIGDERAKSMGINVERLRMEMFIVISLLTATAVAFVGSIGFVGIVGPHIARILLGEDQRFFIPMSALGGAAILSIASVVSKIVVPGAVFPIGILTSLIGVPVFFALILRKR